MSGRHLKGSFYVVAMLLRGLLRSLFIVLIKPVYILGELANIIPQWLVMIEIV
jgi:hypothetical protein